MGLFDHFKPKSKPSTQEDRENLRKELRDGIIEANAQKTMAKAGVERAITKARNAIQANNNGIKAVAFNELRIHLALYRYMGALGLNLQLMESNLSTQSITENFAGIVHRMAKLRIPTNTMNYNKLTAEALRGIRPTQLAGVEQMTKSLIEGSISATNSTLIEDKYLEDLVYGRISLDDELDVPMVPSASSFETEQSIPADPDETELMEILNKISNGLRNGG